MKKFLAVIGGVFAAVSIVAVAAVILKKIRLSFSIESAADDDLGFDTDDFGDVSVSIDEDKPEPSEEQSAETTEETTEEPASADAE